MSAIVWIVLVAIVVAVLTFLATHRVPLEQSGALLMRKELQKRNISVDGLPPEFYSECVDFAKKASAFQSGAVAKKAEFVRSIESLANMVELWRRDPDSPMFKQHGDTPSKYRSLFERYGL